MDSGVDHDEQFKQKQQQIIMMDGTPPFSKTTHISDSGSFEDTTTTTTSMPSPSSSSFQPYPSPVSQDDGGSTTTNDNRSTAWIVAFEVVFSVFVFGVVAGCYIFGMRRRRRQRQLQREYDQQYAAAQQACSESMIERAYNRHEQLPPTIRLYTNDSSAASSMLQLPPYFPPDSTLRLPEHAVARLSQAMLMAHMGRHYISPPQQPLYTQSSTTATSSASSITATPPPKYSSVVLTRPPPSYCSSSTPTTRTSSRSSI